MTDTPRVEPIDPSTPITPENFGAYLRRMQTLMDSLGEVLHDLANVTGDLAQAVEDLDRK